MGRKIVIGDIHGGFKALDQVVQLVNLQPADELIFLGDYADGWSQTAQVIDYLMDLDTKYKCIFLRGNHDAWAEEWLRTGLAEPAEWVRNGGAQTMASYEGYSRIQMDRHLEFFQKMLYYVIDEENRLFVHAGFSATQGPAKEHHNSSFFWDRTLWEMALAMDKQLDPESVFYPRRLKLFKEIYIGHTPSTNYGITTPINAMNVWNIDTGAAFRGTITAMDISSRQYWQSDPIWQLYPDEKGRNK